MPPPYRPEPNIVGSANSVSPPMVEMNTVKMMIGRNCGTVICQNCRREDAPSIAAASYRSRGIVCIAARKMIAL